MSVTADNQHIRIRLKQNIARKRERKIKNKAAKIERSRSTAIDSSVTSSFWREVDGHIKTVISSNKIVMTTTGNTATASEKGLLPNVKLHEKSRELDMLP